MMLMRMRLDKSQIPGPVIKHTTADSTNTLNRDLYIQAGYTAYTAMIVGSAGGQSGRAGGVISGRTVYVYPGGGGGGESKRVSGNLKDLPPLPQAVIGHVGANGADNAANTTGVKAGTGVQGSSTTFNGVSSGGGYGGVGGNVYSTNPDFVEDSVGGRGGGTAAGATGDGVWDDTTKTGKGGQGGRGDNWDSSFGGAQGYSTVPSVGSKTGAGDIYKGLTPVAPPAYNGGYGGGVNVAPVTGGAAEYYGHRTGAVIIKVS